MSENKVHVQTKIVGANFPKTPEGRTYHVDTKKGEVANRIILVGDLARAKSISKLFDQNTEKFELLSSRGFLTITGTYNGVPVTVVGTGMGFPMVDFSIRELRAIVDGDMVMVRIGTCGSVHEDVAVGDVVVNDAAILISRNVDAYREDEPGTTTTTPKKYFNFSRPVKSDPEVSKVLLANMQKQVKAGNNKVVVGLDATADSFYSSQGRIGTDFEDHNENLIQDLKKVYPNITTLEMESFHLFDMASISKGTIRAGSALIVLAQRLKDEFIDLELKHQRELELGRATLDAITEIKLNNTMSGTECVWNKKI